MISSPVESFPTLSELHQHSIQMKLLLDTCTFLWMIDSTEHLSSKAREALEDPSNSLAFHQVSAWEIQIKYQSGKLKLATEPEVLIQEATSKLNLDYKPLQNDDIWLLQKLPSYHKDPFDRILIAHALSEGMKLVTPDPHIHKSPVPVFW